jgi:hypothetical protein
MNWTERVFHDGLIDWDELARHNRCLENAVAVAEAERLPRCEATTTCWGEWRNDEKGGGE